MRRTKTSNQTETRDIERQTYLTTAKATTSTKTTTTTTTRTTATTTTAKTPNEFMNMRRFCIARPARQLPYLRPLPPARRNAVGCHGNNGRGEGAHKEHAKNI